MKQQMLTVDELQVEMGYLPFCEGCGREDCSCFCKRCDAFTDLCICPKVLKEPSDEH